jgi:hypothetical protein
MEVFVYGLPVNLIYWQMTGKLVHCEIDRQNKALIGEILSGLFSFRCSL